MNSKIILAKNINMDRNYNNVLSYTESQMLELLTSQTHLVNQASNYSFIRYTGSIMAGFSYSECLQANYIAFQNPDYSNKWFFAWIDDIVYKGDRNTEILFTVDSWSTWWEYWTKKSCFVTRHHVNDDTIGANTIPENLDVGEVVQESLFEDASYDNSQTFWVAIASNWDIEDGSTDAQGTQYAGITVYDNNISGTKIFLFKINSISYATDFLNISNFLLRTNNDKHIADVENIFILPDAMIDETKLSRHTAYLLDTSKPFSFYRVSYDIEPTIFNTELNKITSFIDYTPKNNKCFVYPYNYLFVSNNQGSNNIYRYEDFSTTKCIFENQLSISIGGSGRLVPKNYKQMSSCDDEALPLAKFPTCGWSSDAFINWLTQNSVNMAVSAGLSAGSLVAGGITGGLSTKDLEISDIASNTGEMTTNISSSVAGQIGQFYQASLLPNISGGQATGDIIWSANRNKFTFRAMRVKTEYLRRIDNYFSRFGYAINDIVVPNTTGRTYWNYVEIGSSEEIGYGNVPSKFMNDINNACRKGVTIWHNHANLGNFSLNNSIA